jgi:hypothetical protein
MRKKNLNKTALDNLLSDGGEVYLNRRPRFTPPSPRKIPDTHFS